MLEEFGLAFTVDFAVFEYDDAVWFYVVEDARVVRDDEERILVVLRRGDSFADDAQRIDV